MNPTDTKITRKELNIIAKNNGIREPHKMSVKELLNTLSRHDIKHKSYNICRKFRKLGLNKFVKNAKNDLRKATKLHNKSLDDLKKTARLRKIKNYGNLSKEDLIYTLLRSEKNYLEDNYMKYINNDTDDKIKTKINNIRLTLPTLGNIVPKKYKNILRKDLYEIENKKNLTKAQRERIYNNLIKLANILDKKEEHKYSDYDDMDNFGLRDIENLFHNIDDSDYYKPALVKSSFNNNYEEYEMRGDRNKNLSVEQYFYMITPKLAELIDKKKNKNEQKIQLSMGLDFKHTTGRDKNRTFYVKSDNVEIRIGSNTMMLLLYSLNHF